VPDSLFPDSHSDPASPDYDPSDPFKSLADSRELLKPTGKSFGKRVLGKSLADNLAQRLECGLPEDGEGIRKRPRPVDHHKRSRAYFEARGWTVNKLEHWVQGRNGVSWNQDYLGLFDIEATKDGEPRVLVQICGRTGKSAHLRTMCSSKPAQDNRKPRIANLRYALGQGWKCYLLIWTKNKAGRYDPELFRITPEIVAATVARQRNKG
jgi:hypothetical protein